MDKTQMSAPREPDRATLRSVARGRSPLPIILIVILLYGVSGGMLWLMGYNYDGVTGSALTKIHPSTYLIVVVYIWHAVTCGDPVGYIVSSAARTPGSVLLLFAMFTLFIQTVLLGAPGMAGDLDTFLPPTLLVALMLEIGPPGNRQAALALHVMMTVNAFLGLIEFATGAHFFPYTLDGISISDPRSSSLQGHPLENASLTAVYILALLSGGRSVPTALKGALIGLQFAALITFGGRTATIVSIVLGGPYLLAIIYLALQTGRIPILSAAATLFLITLLPLVIAVFWTSGFFDALFGRFVDDSGSAAARERMFSMFDSLTFRDLLIGPDPSLVSSIRSMQGLDQGIENPILSTLLYHGVGITLLMVGGIGAFLREIARYCASRGWLPLLAFVILLNGSNTISTKSTALTKYAVMMLCLYQPRRTMAATLHQAGTSRRTDT